MGKTLKVRLKTCEACRRRFTGSIDDSGRFCSVKCKLSRPDIVTVCTVDPPPDTLRKTLIENRRLKQALANLVKKKKPQKRKRPGNPFYNSEEWMAIAYRARKVYGRRCMSCQTTSGEMHVDHIKPRSRYPELALDFNNLQVLCRQCNFGKGAWDETDWRKKG